MNNKVIFGTLAGVLLVGASVGGYLIFSDSKEPVVGPGVKPAISYEVTEEVEESDNSIGISLPTKEFNSLLDAQEELSYTIKAPSIRVNNEGISKIKISVPDGVNLGQDLYVTYAEGGKPVYEISETSQPLNYPEDAEKIVSGSITYNYVESEFFEEQNENAVALGGIYVSRSFIFWTDGNVTYQISEYGNVDKNQIIELAGSMKEIK